MTVELDNVIKNLRGALISIELTNEDDYYEMYIETENGTGSSYDIQSIEDIGDMVKHYLFTYYADENSEDEEE